MSDMRIFSFGGGVQSMAVLVLAAQGKVAYDAFVFCQVGEDSENPATLDYIREVAEPYAAAHGLKFVTVQKTLFGKPTTILTELQRSRSVNIPAYLNGGAPASRQCTANFKIRVVDKWIREQIPGGRCVVGLGISTDEFDRVGDTGWRDVERLNAKHPRKLRFWKQNEYPLIDLRLNRARCEALILREGLPIPPKSACFFCPFTSRSRWIEMKRTDPALFAKAVEIEHMLNAKPGRIGKTTHLHRDRKPLEEAVSDQLNLFADDDDSSGCAADGGYCMV